MVQADRDPIEPPKPEPIVADAPSIEVPSPAVSSPEVAALLATVDRLTASLAERDKQLSELVGPEEYIALRACDRGGFTTEAVRKWCEKGLVVSRREGSGKRARIYVNTRSLAARLARLGLSKAIKRR
jgi:hypothetical protein